MAAISREKALNNKTLNSEIETGISKGGSSPSDFSQ